MSVTVAQSIDTLAVCLTVISSWQQRRHLIRIIGLVWGKSTSDRWIPCTNGQKCEKKLYGITSSHDILIQLCQTHDASFIDIATDYTRCCYFPAVCPITNLILHRNSVSVKNQISYGTNCSEIRPVRSIFIAGAAKDTVNSTLIGLCCFSVADHDLHFHCIIVISWYLHIHGTGNAGVD